MSVQVESLAAIPVNSSGLDSRQVELHRLLSSFPVAAYTCDRDGLITYFNAMAVELWGREPQLNSPVDRFCGSFKMFTGDGTPVAHEACWMALALRDEQAYSGQEIVVERPDGTRINGLAHVNPIRNQAGEVIGAVNVVVDITMRKRGDEAQALLAAIVTSSDDAIISKTLDGIILSWNSAAERLFGWTSAEVVGKSILQIIPPERHMEEQDILSRLRRGERVEHYETVRVSKDGTLINVSLTASPVRDSSGRIIARRDITASKQAQAALVAVKDQLATQLADVRRLHEMSARLSTTLELQPILAEILRTAAEIHDTDLGLLSLVDADETRLEVGASLGFDRALVEAIESLPLDGAACGIAYLEKRRVVVEDVSEDARLQPQLETARAGGFQAVHCTPLQTRRGIVIGVLALSFRWRQAPTEREIHLIDLCARQAVDFIENARLYVQLRDADRAKNEFLATLAHELRNPLAPIRNAAHILQMKGPQSPEMQWVLNVIERQMKQMTRLVDDLLDVARITGNKLELRKERVDLAEILHTAAETSRPLIEACGQQFVIRASDRCVYLHVDATRIAQSISNLLNNAAKYGERGGCIWLGAELEDDAVVVSVRDDGMGIPADMLPRIFELFTQVDRSLERSQGGLGIGLSLVKRLVEMHGGTVTAQSNGPGTGTEFRIRLPAALR